MKDKLELLLGFYLLMGLPIIAINVILSKYFEYDSSFIILIQMYVGFVLIIVLI